MTDLTGTWLGTYWQQGKPTRFEATLVHSGNSLTGNILDDSYLGEATLDGEVIGRSVSFVKRYIALKREQAPVNYQGTVSGDGNYLQGTWDFFGKWGFCLWEAHRSRENLMVELKHRLEQKLPVTSGTAANIRLGAINAKENKTVNSYTHAANALNQMLKTQYQLHMSLLLAHLW